MALYATPYPSMEIGGGTYEYKIESALGTPAGSYKFVRADGEPTLATQTRHSLAQPNLGHAVPYNMSDQPIPYEMFRESSFVFPQYIRMSSTVDATPPQGMPFLGNVLESMGCTAHYLSTAVPTTIATYASETSWTLTDDVIDNAAGEDTGGHMMLVQLNSGSYYPVLMSDYVQSTKTVKAAMALPSASNAAKVIEQMYTFHPRTQKVPSDKTMYFRIINRMGRGYTFAGCAGASLAPIVIEPSKPVLITPTFHVADIAEGSQTLAAETFGERTTVQYANNNAGGFQFLFANASASGAIANTPAELIKAEVDLGISTVPIPAEGSTECLNGIAGYMSSYKQATITLTLIYHATRVSDFQASPAQTNKFIGFVQPTSSLTTPAYAMYFPNCYLLEEPTAEVVKGNWIQQTLKYGAVSAGYDTLPSADQEEEDPEMAPWYFGISAKATPDA